MTQTCPLGKITAPTLLVALGVALQKPRALASVGTGVAGVVGLTGLVGVFEPVVPQPPPQATRVAVIRARDERLKMRRFGFIAINSVEFKLRRGPRGGQNQKWVPAARLGA